MAYTEQTKNSATWSNQSKNSATFTNQLRHGIELKIEDIADKTFTDTIFDGGKEIKDTTFEELQPQTWTLQNKN